MEKQPLPGVSACVFWRLLSRLSDTHLFVSGFHHGFRIQENTQESCRILKDQKLFVLFFRVYLGPLAPLVQKGFTSKPTDRTVKPLAKDQVRHSRVLYLYIP